MIGAVKKEVDSAPFLDVKGRVDLSIFPTGTMLPYSKPDRVGASGLRPEVAASLHRPKRYRLGLLYFKGKTPRGATAPQGIFHISEKQTISQ